VIELDSRVADSKFDTLAIDQHSRDLEPSYRQRNPRASMMGLDLIGSELPDRLDKHHRVRRQHPGTRPMRAPRSLAKAVVQIALVKRRDGSDRGFGFVNAIQKDLIGSFESHQPKRD